MFLQTQFLDLPFLDGERLSIPQRQAQFMLEGGSAEIAVPITGQALQINSRHRAEPRRQRGLHLGVEKGFQQSRHRQREVLVMKIGLVKSGDQGDQRLKQDRFEVLNVICCVINL